jgi:hypothetical protein
MPTDVSKEHISPIFRMEDEAKKETDIKQAASKALLSRDCMALYPKRHVFIVTTLRTSDPAYTAVLEQSDQENIWA